MNCPHCKTVDLVVIEREGVEIDYCPTCRGVWLERNELETIIRRAAEYAAPTAPTSRPEPYEPRNKEPYMEKRHYDDDRHKHDSYRGDHYKHDPYKKKKGGFLEDLFDF